MTKCKTCKVEGFSDVDIDLAMVYISEVPLVEISEAGLYEDEFKIIEIHPIGSRVTGESTTKSDLDFVVYYTGTMREDDAFNMFNRHNLTIDGIPIDVNPKNIEDIESIDQDLKPYAEYKKKK